VQNLIRRCALTGPTHQRTALNLVDTWNAGLTSNIIAVPFVGSFLISVIWPIVARRKYHADIQTSIQTGFTIGSYVVTAGEWNFGEFDLADGTQEDFLLLLLPS
jgi:fluoride ion exporter CrcB/FEX